MIVKNGQRICGSGGALASAPLVQSKAYFEVKIQQSGNYDKYLQLSELLFFVNFLPRETFEVLTAGSMKTALLGMTPCHLHYISEFIHQ